MTLLVRNKIFDNEGIINVRCKNDFVSVEVVIMVLDVISLYKVLKIDFKVYRICDVKGNYLEMIEV